MRQTPKGVVFGSTCLLRAGTERQGRWAWLAEPSAPPLLAALLAWAPGIARRTSGLGEKLADLLVPADDLLGSS